MRKSHRQSLPPGYTILPDGLAVRTVVFEGFGCSHRYEVLIREAKTGRLFRVERGKAAFGRWEKKIKDHVVGDRNK